MNEENYDKKIIKLTDTELLEKLGYEDWEIESIDAQGNGRTYHKFDIHLMKEKKE